MFGKLTRNIVQTIHRPSMALRYLQYNISKIPTGSPTRKLYGSLNLTGFVNFSEWLSCARAVNENEYRWLTEWPFHDGLMIDIGANLGIVSLILSERYGERDIHAFEPHPETYNALVMNVKRNNARNITTNQLAIGRKSEILKFLAEEHSRPTSKIIRNQNSRAIDVKSISLDEYVFNLDTGSVAFLKVDVEGFETWVFEGAKELLHKGLIGVIYYEVCPELTIMQGFDPYRPSSVLESFGYKLFRLNEKAELQPVDLSSLDQVKLENWIALKT